MFMSFMLLKNLTRAPAILCRLSWRFLGKSQINEKPEAQWVRAFYQYLEGREFDSNWELIFCFKHFFVVPYIYFYSVDSSYLDGRLASIVRKSVR